MQRKLVCRALVVVVAMGMVGACATHAQMQGQAIKANNQSAVQQLNACVARIYNSPGYDLLRPHGPLKIQNATIEQMTDGHLATDAEINAVLAEHPKVQACRQSFLDQISQTTPSIVPIFASYLTRNEDSLIDLVKRKISWGDYIRGAKDRFPEMQAELTAEYQRINQGLYQQNQAELAQRQAAANALSQYVQTQQMINALNRPVITNCTQFGYNTNCVTQ